MAEVKMPEYQDNSEVAKKVEVKEPEKKEAGELRKRPASKRIRDSILPKEDRQAIGDYIIFDVVIPAVKNTISDVVKDAIDMFLFPNDSGRRRSSRSGYTDYAKPSSKYSRSRDDDEYERRERRRSAKNIDDILFSSHARADAVYNALLDYIDEYGHARVSDLFEEAGVTVPDWTYDSYGWEQLPVRANIEHVRTRDADGRPVTKYALVLPNPYRLRK